MTQYHGTTATTRRRLANRWRAWLLSLDGSPARITELPGPRSIGSLVIGQHMLDGQFRFAGRHVTARGASVWDIRAPDDAFFVDMHSCVWLDHMAALATKQAADVARSWVLQWVRLFGRGHGLAWSAELVGQRQIRFLHHYDDLARDMAEAEIVRIASLLRRQGKFLARRWKLTPEGTPRLDAIAAAILSARCVEGVSVDLHALSRGVQREVTRLLDAHGGLASRNPEELLRLLSLMIWIRDDLEVLGQTIPQTLSDNIALVAPMLRGIRHSDGGLARMQGGGAGVNSGLDQALAASGTRDIRRDGGMGYARMASGRTSVLIDAAVPARGDESYEAHASSLAFEVTSGRRPLIVSCGAGGPFGPDWQKAGRATPSHSVMGLDGYSSSRLGRTRDILGQPREQMDQRPSEIEHHLERHLDYLRFEASHDGYLRSHGLLQGRALELTIDGSAVAGEEVLLSEGRRARAKFDKLVDGAKQGVPFTIRFHLHPDVLAEYDLELNAYRMTLQNGEVWIFRHDGACEMALESSVYLASEALKPTATKQVVLTSRALAYATRIRWSLSKTPESLKGIRDVAQQQAELTD